MAYDSRQANSSRILLNFSQTWIQVKHFQLNSDQDPPFRVYTEIVEKFLDDSNFKFGRIGFMFKVNAKTYEKFHNQRKRY
jgi:hypothetical protein